MVRATNLFAAPRIAWPTLGVFASACALWLLALWGAANSRAPAMLTVPLAALAAYAAFTPLHEAVHRSVSRFALLNGAVGRLSALLLLAPFPVAKHFHLEHHRFTNDRERDPDAWSGLGPAWLLPLRWATQDLHYYRLFLRALRTLGLSARIESLVTSGLGLGLLTIAWLHGHGGLVLLQVILPARLAILVLAFSFDYLPHFPYGVTAAQDRYRTTRVFDSALLNLVLLGQAYHLIHHLYPAVPFYRYRALWEQQRAKLLAQGSSVRFGPR
jgi:fatty acid desaturase